MSLRQWLTPALAAVAVAAVAPAAERGPVEGLPASAVRVVVYEDLQCPDCAAFRAMLSLARG